MQFPRLLDETQTGQFNLIWLVLLLPLVGFVLQCLLGSVVQRSFGTARGRWLLGAMAVLPIAAAFVLAVIVVGDLAALPADKRLAISTWFDWIDLQSIRVPFELRIDPLSMTMVLIVTGVGGLIHLYATGYMAKERDYPRFFCYLNLFISFMLMLVLGNNLALAFIGWEGVGLCSYLLIGFWYEDLSNARAANKAFIVNRIGDWGMSLGIFLIAVVMASSGLLPQGETRYLSFDVILPWAEQVLGAAGSVVATAIPLLLFVGAMGKSAQFPLYLWLPDAMAGPTPVSALIHAATMVTAGVYLVARCHIFFELSPIAMFAVAAVGAFTAVFAATVAWGQFDIKKVLAYSTVSQLGYMFLACGVGAFGAGMFHVTTHAFFKALLFLGSGAVIHAMAHNQDLRNYGNLRRYLPITYFSMMMGWLAICGIPIWAGFFSKDDILGKTFLSSHYWNEHGWPVAPIVLYGIGILTAVLTAAYMTRMFWLTFLSGDERWRSLPEPSHTHHVHSTHPQGSHVHAEADVHGFFADADASGAHDENDEHHDLTSEHVPREVGPAMWIPLAVLAALSLVGGLVLSGGYPVSELLGLHLPNLFSDWNAPSVGTHILPTKELFHGTHMQEWILIGVSIAAALLGILYMRRRYRSGIPTNEESRLRGAAGAQWYYDSAMQKVFVHVGGQISEGVYRVVDKGVIDGVVVGGSSGFIAALGKLLRKAQTGYVRSYAMVLLVGGIGILSYIFYVTFSIGSN
jgi:NADH-quinone oxidoreductase subunit L